MNTHFDWKEQDHPDPNSFIFKAQSSKDGFEINICRAIDGWECQLLQREIDHFGDLAQSGQVLDTFTDKTAEEAKLKADKLAYRFIMKK